MDHEKQLKKSDRLLGINVFVFACVAVILIILATSFQRTDGGMLSDEIYLRSDVVELGVE